MEWDIEVTVPLYFTDMGTKAQRGKHNSLESFMLLSFHFYKCQLVPSRAYTVTYTTPKYPAR